MHCCMECVNHNRPIYDKEKTLVRVTSLHSNMSFSTTIDSVIYIIFPLFIIVPCFKVGNFGLLKRKTF